MEAKTNLITRVPQRDQFDRATKDYALYLDGEFVGYAGSYQRRRAQTERAESTPLLTH